MSGSHCKHWFAHTKHFTIHLLLTIVMSFWDLQIKIHFENITLFTFSHPVPALFGWGQCQICQCSVPAETQQEVVSEQLSILFLCYALIMQFQFGYCLVLCQWCSHLVQKIKAQALQWARRWSTQECVDYLEKVACWRKWSESRGGATYCETEEYVKVCRCAKKSHCSVGLVNNMTREQMWYRQHMKKWDDWTECLKV